MDGPAGGNDESRAYDVRAEKAGSIWFISVPDVPDALASTRQYDEIEGIARRNHRAGARDLLPQVSRYSSVPRMAERKSSTAGTGGATKSRRPRSDWADRGRLARARGAWRAPLSESWREDPDVPSSSLAHAPWSRHW